MRGSQAVWCLGTFSYHPYIILHFGFDYENEELLQNFLQEAGYEVAVANDGVEALSLFAGERYDLIVLDIMLPKIDGYGVCELIRKQSDVPIIMLTALSGEEDQIKVFLPIAYRIADNRIKRKSESQNGASRS